MLGPVIESFVDLSYRGLSLGRRIKLTQVRPSTGYLEHPTPMPVGTAVSIATDDGIVLEAVVTHVHEQVGGSDKVPGMTVKPALAEQQLQAWWRERVALPELEPPKRVERSRPITVRPRTHTVPTPPPPAAVALDRPTLVDAVVVDVPVDPPEIAMSKKTMVMNAVDQELLENLTRNPNDIERLTRSTGEHEIVDDGKQTLMMEAVDPAALGLDVTASGSMAAADDEDDSDGDDKPENGDGNGSGDDKKPKGSVKRRKKRR